LQRLIPEKKNVYLVHPDDVGVPDELHGRDLSLYLQNNNSTSASKVRNQPRSQRTKLTVPTKQRRTRPNGRQARRRNETPVLACLPATVKSSPAVQRSHLIFRRFHFSYGGGSREISERRQIILTQRDLLRRQGKEREFKFHRTSKRKNQLGGKEQHVI